MGKYQVEAVFSGGNT